MKSPNPNKNHNFLLKTTTFSNKTHKFLLKKTPTLRFAHNES